MSAIQYLKNLISITWAKTLVKTSECLLVFCNKIESGVSAIKSKIYVTRSRAKATIDLRTIEQIEPVKFEWKSTNPWQMGVIAQQIGNVGNPWIYNNIIPNNTITFSQAGKSVLTITNDGDVEWTGKPSEAADAIMQALQLNVENMQGITSAARRRYYAMACRNLLEKANQMSHEEFLDFLNNQVYNRESRVIMDSLKGEENE
jgi:hypothetical protein